MVIFKLMDTEKNELIKTVTLPMAEEKLMEVMAAVEGRTIKVCHRDRNIYLPRFEGDSGFDLDGQGGLETFEGFMLTVNFILKSYKGDLETDDDVADMVMCYQLEIIDGCKSALEFCYLSFAQDELRIYLDYFDLENKIKDRLMLDTKHDTGYILNFDFPANFRLLEDLIIASGPEGKKEDFPHLFHRDGKERVSAGGPLEAWAFAFNEELIEHIGLAEQSLLINCFVTDQITEFLYDFYDVEMFSRYMMRFIYDRAWDAVREHGSFCLDIKDIKIMAYTAVVAAICEREKIDGTLEDDDEFREDEDDDEFLEDF